MPEPLPRQRHLVNLRLHTADVQERLNHAFPFVDQEWNVPFLILNVSVQGPRLFRGPLEVRSDGLHTKESVTSLRPVDELSPESFQALVHFDPWWVFRVEPRVDKERTKAIVSTNVSGTFEHEGVKYALHDLEFDTTLQNLIAVHAKDRFFKPAVFQRGEINLLDLRHRGKA
jgi:hypothetical protein